MSEYLPTRTSADPVRRKAVLILSWVLAVLCMAAIFCFSHQPADDSAALSEGVLAKLMAWFSIEIPHWLVRKLAHMTEYCGLGLLLLNALYQTGGRPRPWLALCCCAAYAVTDEIHQYFIPGRACQLRDVLIDTAGAWIGILAGWCLLRLFRLLSAGRKNRRRAADDAGGSP